MEAERENEDASEEEELDPVRRCASWCNLSEIPLKMISCQTLERVFFSNNSIVSVPPEIGLLTALSILSLRHNQYLPLLLPPPPLNLKQHNSNHDHLSLRITSLPPEIGNLCSLQRLTLDYNKLTSLPAAMVQLTSLQHMVVSNNQLTVFPDLPSSLTYLAIAHNAIATFHKPAVLPKLEVLNIFANPPQTMPLCFFRNLLSLKTFLPPTKEPEETYKETTTVSHGDCACPSLLGLCLREVARHRDDVLLEDILPDELMQMLLKGGERCDSCNLEFFWPPVERRSQTRIGGFFPSVICHFCSQWCCSQWMNREECARCGFN